MAALDLQTLLAQQNQQMQQQQMQQQPQMFQTAPIATFTNPVNTQQQQTKVEQTNVGDTVSNGLNISIVGYIADNYNFLVKTVDPALVEAFNKEQYEARIAKGEKPNEVSKSKKNPKAIFHLPKFKKSEGKGREAVKDETGKQAIVKLTEKCKTIGVVLSLDEKKYDELKARADYKVQFNELKPAYLIVKNNDIQAGGQRNGQAPVEWSRTARELSNRSFITDATGTYSILPIMRFIDLQFALKAAYVPVKIGDSVVGRAISVKKAKTNAINEFKYSVKFYDTLNSPVPELGYLKTAKGDRVPYAVNKDNRSTTKTKVATLVNKDKLSELFPSTSANDLRAKKPAPAKGEKRVVNYTPYGKEFTAINVTKEMFDLFRSAAGSSKTKAKNFEEVLNAFNNTADSFTGM